MQLHKMANITHAYRLRMVCMEVEGQGVNMVRRTRESFSCSNIDFTSVAQLKLASFLTKRNYDPTSNRF